MPRSHALRATNQRAADVLDEVARLLREHPTLPQGSVLSLYALHDQGGPRVFVSVDRLGEVGAWAEVLRAPVTESRPLTHDGRTIVVRATRARVGGARIEISHCREVAPAACDAPRACERWSRDRALTVDSRSIPALLAELAGQPGVPPATRAAGDLIAATAVAAWQPAGWWWRREEDAAGGQPGRLGTYRWRTEQRITISWWMLRMDQRYARLTAADRRLLALAEVIDTGRSIDDVDLAGIDEAQIPLAVAALAAVMHTPARRTAPAPSAARLHRDGRRRRAAR